MGVLAKFKAACVVGRKVTAEFPPNTIRGNLSETLRPASTVERTVATVTKSAVAFSSPGRPDSHLPWPKASELRQDSALVFRLVHGEEGSLIVKYTFMSELNSQKMFEEQLKIIEIARVRTDEAHTVAAQAVKELMQEQHKTRVAIDKAVAIVSEDADWHDAITGVALDADGLLVCTTENDAEEEPLLDQEPDVISMVLRRLRPKLLKP